MTCWGGKHTFTWGASKSCEPVPAGQRCECGLYTIEEARKAAAPPRDGSGERE